MYLGSKSKDEEIGWALAAQQPNSKPPWFSRRRLNALELHGDEYKHGHGDENEVRGRKKNQGDSSGYGYQTC